MRDASVFEDTRIEPFADQSQQHPIPHPTLEKVAEVAVVDRIKEFSNIDIHDPAAPHRQRLLPEAVERLMRRPSRAEAIRAVLEVLFVDCFQHHDDRPLEYLIREGRNPQRPSFGRGARLGDMDPPHRRRVIRPGLGSVQQRLKVAQQVGRIRFAILSVHAHRAVFAGAVERFQHPSQVDEVGQRRESHLRALSSEFCDPLLFRGHVHGFRCTRHVSLQRFRNTAPPSLRRVPRGGSPASAVLRGAPTPVRPFRRTSLPSFGDTTRASGLLPAAGTRGRGHGEIGVPVPEPDMSVEMDGSPKFLGTPRVPWPCSSTPVGSVTPGHRGVPTRSPRLTRARTPTRSFRGSIARPRHWLSTLRSGSRLPPRKTRFRLLARLYRAGFVHPQGSNERFLSSSLVLLSQGSWRNVSSSFLPEKMNRHRITRVLLEAPRAHAALLVESLAASPANNCQGDDERHNAYAGKGELRQALAATGLAV